MSSRKSIAVVGIVAICLTISGVYFYAPSAAERLTYDPEFQAEVKDMFSESGINAHVDAELGNWRANGVSPLEAENSKRRLRMHFIENQLKAAFRRRGQFSLPISKLTKPEADAVIESARLHAEESRAARMDFHLEGLGSTPIVKFDLDNLHNDHVVVEGVTTIFSF